MSEEEQKPPPARRRQCRTPEDIAAVCADFPGIPRHILATDMANRLAEGLGNEILVDPSGKGYTPTGM